MSKFPACLVVAEPPLDKANIVPLRNECADDAPLVPTDAQPRETSWRDLVRRLSKTPAKR